MTDQVYREAERELRTGAPSRRAYVVLIGIAVVMSVAAVVVSLAVGQGLKDPDGSLGPSYVRLPLMVLGAFLLDVVPRSLWRSRLQLTSFPSVALALVKEHWTLDRVKLLVIGLVGFYLTYVSYRNLKNFLPRVNDSLHDPALHAIDRALTFGHEPAVLLHQLLGDNLAAQFLALVYLLFLPVSPFSLIAFLVWSRNISYGYWYATAQCLAWLLGTVSYYVLPTLGPAFWYVWLYKPLAHTDVADMQHSLFYSRADVLYTPLTTNSIQSVAGFASLHVGIILTLALVVQFTVRHAWARRTMWLYFVLTVVSTLYFGWHYIADDVAGALIAFVSVYVGGRATGQKFGRWGRFSHPTTTSSKIPLYDEADSSA